MPDSRLPRLQPVGAVVDTGATGITGGSDSYTIAVAVNDEEILQKNLYLSPDLCGDCTPQILIKKGFESASLAYNAALDEAVNNVIIFVHQDIYLPARWFSDLRRCLSYLEREKINWGVLGCFGSRENAEGGLGRVYTNGLGAHGRWIDRPEPVETLDEIVLIFRKSSGLRFDSAMPHFHLYGTDICMAARDKGLVNYAFQGFCVHNTNQLMHLPKEFYECYRFIRKKWAKFLPIYASCMKITLLGRELHLRRMREAGERALGVSNVARRRVEDPRTFLCDRGDPNEHLR